MPTWVLSEVRVTSRRSFPSSNSQRDATLVGGGMEYQSAGGHIGRRRDGVPYQSAGGHIGRRRDWSTS
jgi:hypothetical protein